MKKIEKLGPFSYPYLHGQEWLKHLLEIIVSNYNKTNDLVKAVNELQEKDISETIADIQKEAKKLYDQGLINVSPPDQPEECSCLSAVHCSGCGDYANPSKEKHKVEVWNNGGQHCQSCFMFRDQPHTHEFNNIDYWMFTSDDKIVSDDRLQWKRCECGAFMGEPK